MASSLTPEERRQYDEQGFLLVKGLFDADAVEGFRRRFRDIVEGRVATAERMVVMKDVMVAKGVVRPESALGAIAKIQDFHRDPVLFEGYCRSPELLARVEGFCGPDIKSIHNMLINKPPGVDGRHPLHQDLLYFPFRPADRIVGTWTALVPCRRRNGCLAVVPGSHKGELLEHESPDWDYVNFLYVGARSAGRAAPRLHLEMEPGDTLFFHPLLLHGSGRNRSPGFRPAISCHYASARCRFLEGQRPLPGSVGRPYVLVQGREHEGCI